MRIPIYALTLAFILSTRVLAADWPQWRGPTGQGLFEGAEPPAKWDGKTGENILWKTPLPKGDTPYSSPIVQGDRVIITLAMNKGREHHVLCFDKTTGKQLWDTAVEAGPWNLTDVRGGYAASTPAADSERIYALFGSAVLAAIDFDGKIAWKRDLPRHMFDVAIGCSPLPFRDTLILQSDMLQKQSSLIAFDKKTGEIRWETKRPEAGFAHSTPTIITVDGKPVMLVAASDALQAADPITGQMLWSCKAKGDTVSPVFADGIAYIDSGRGGQGFAVAVDATLKGDVSKTALRWNLKQVPEAFGSPLIVGPHLYRLQGPGILKCIAVADGTEVYSQRLDGAQAAISPVVSKQGTIYFASSGRSYVIKAGPKYELLSTNNLDDANYASPAIADGKLFFKGVKFLYCVGRKGD